MMKLAVMRTATGKEDPELPLLQRISSLLTSLTNCSPNKSSRVQVTDISTSTVQRIQVFVNQAFVVEVLQRNHY
jgi:hypothetical protein